MSLLKHQRFSGFGLLVFALVEIAVSVYTGIRAFELRSQLMGSEVQLLFTSFVTLGFALAVILLILQLAGALKLIVSDRPAKRWGLLASTIAIVTLWGFPAGLYAIWIQIRLNRERLNNHG